MISLPVSTHPRTDTPRLPSLETCVRFSLVGVAVALCYQWNWPALRYWTSELNIRLDSLFGIFLQRVGSDTVFWKGVLYQYTNACTFVDVWCGAVPLLWIRRHTVPHNLRALATWFLALTTFNVLRLSFSDVLFDRGVPWALAHNVVGGLSYFAVWVTIVRYRERERGFPAGSGLHFDFGG